MVTLNSSTGLAERALAVLAWKLEPSAESCGDHYFVILLAYLYGCLLILAASVERKRLLYRLWLKRFLAPGFLWSDFATREPKGGAPRVRCSDQYVKGRQTPTLFIIVDHLTLHPQHFGGLDHGETAQISGFVELFSDFGSCVCSQGSPQPGHSALGRIGVSRKAYIWPV
jgi:hypothetical protein